MTTLLLILALTGCGCVIASAFTKIPVWIGTLLIGLAVVLPLAIAVFK